MAALGAAGFTFTSLQLAGLVGVAIGGIWALGLSMKYALAGAWGGRGGVEG